MKIAIRGGHNVGVPGAHSILDEVTEDRKYYKSVMNYLRQAGHEVIDVTPGRTSTSAEDLQYGVNKANNAKVDLFISCHLNAGGGKGAEVLYLSDKGKVYATKVVNSISALGFANRKAKEDTRGLYELKHTNMPAIIIEPLFVDTQSDADLYCKVGYDRLGKVIAEAISGKTIVNKVEEEIDMNKIVLYFNDLDVLSAVLVAQKYACPVMKKADYDRSGLKAKTVITIGGKPGSTRFTTFKDAAALV